MRTSLAPSLAITDSSPHPSPNHHHTLTGQGGASHWHSARGSVKVTQVPIPGVLSRVRLPHFLGELMTDGKPKPGAAKPAIGVGLHLLERDEGGALLLQGDADPGIPDPEGQPVVFIIHLDGDRPCLGELHRVVQQIGDHLPHPYPVDAGQIRHRLPHRSVTLSPLP